MTDNPREQLVEIIADAGVHPVDILDAVFAERELVIAALGGERVGWVRFCRDHGEDYPVFDTVRMGEPVEPVYRFSSVGERQETP